MFYTKNPYNLQPLESFEFDTTDSTNKKLTESDQAFLNWSTLSVEERTTYILKVIKLLNEQKLEAAHLITQEMGKPISQSISEIEKCILLCEYYIKKAPSFLEIQPGEDPDTYVYYEALGSILGIMPWNYPFWQVFRFAIPTLLAGNTIVIKHALNVAGCATLIASIFREALGEYKGAYQNLFLDNQDTEQLISSPYIKGVSLTGSTRAGIAVGKMTGANLKPVVLELGGSNALIAFEDADIDKSIDAVIAGRFSNNGQSCIAVKRLLVHKHIADKFKKTLTERISQLQHGDPTNKNTYISSLSKEKFAKDLKEKLEKSLILGATLEIGGTQEGAFFEPTFVSDVTTEMPIFKEETFGPLITMTCFSSEEEAITLANGTEYGLGVSVFSKDVEHMLTLIPKFKDASVFINSFVKSRPSLPFGGTKKSGIGRELSEEGIKSFVNTKTVVVYK